MDMLDAREWIQPFMMAVLAILGAIFSWGIWVTKKSFSIDKKVDEHTSLDEQILGAVVSDLKRGTHKFDRIDDRLSDLDHRIDASAEKLSSVEGKQDIIIDMLKEKRE